MTKGPHCHKLLKLAFVAPGVFILSLGRVQASGGERQVNQLLEYKVTSSLTEVSLKCFRNAAVWQRVGCGESGMASQRGDI